MEAENGRERARMKEVLRDKLQELRRLEADVTLLESTQPPAEVVKAYELGRVLRQIVENQPADPLLRPKTKGEKGCACWLF